MVILQSFLDDGTLKYCVKDQIAGEISIFCLAVIDASHESGIFQDVNVQTVLTLR